jgi:antirestriction protein ArdC
MSLKSRKPYRGVNVFLLTMQGYASPFWVTKKQVAEMGGSVKEGEHGKDSLVVYWNWQKRQVKKASGDLEERDIPFLKYYRTYNLAQIDGIVPMDALDNDSFSPIMSCEEIIAKMPKAPVVESGWARASYSWSADTVKMPPKESFQSESGYYAALFHELVHSTGNKARLNRSESPEHEYGSPEYSKEELVAEIGSSFLLSYAGLGAETIDNSVAYIQSWRRKLSEDKKLIINAAQQAQKAVDFILNKSAVQVKDEILDKAV